MKNIFNRKLPANELPCWSPEKKGSYLYLKKLSNSEIVWDAEEGMYKIKWSREEIKLAAQGLKKSFDILSKSLMINALFS